MQKELQLRILSGIVMAAVVLVTTWTGGIAFQLLAILIALLVYYEWSTITRLAEVDGPGNAFGWLSQLALASTVLLGDIEVSLATLGASAILSALWVGITRRSWWLVGGVVYAGLIGVSMSAIRGDSAIGLIAMLFVFAIVWGTDILAYFVGRAIGGPKLAPRISPGKTWSGAIGGTIAGVAAGVGLFMMNFSLEGLTIPVMALILSVSSQIGDLFESFIKRRFGIKDSSHLIPGHGGVMDRVDGLVFACFAAFLLVVVDAMMTGGLDSSPGAFLLGL